VKATPLAIIGVGLAMAYRANVWNIGAEGQLVMGAVAGSVIPVLLPGWNDPTALVAMLLLGALGGALWGWIPALLKNRFNANEILTSLMLVYVAQLFLDWLVRGPFRDPQGFNFPKSVTFEGWHVMPAISGRVHLGTIIALLAVVALWGGRELSRASPPPASPAPPSCSPALWQVWPAFHPATASPPSSPPFSAG